MSRRTRRLHRSMTIEILEPRQLFASDTSGAGIVAAPHSTAKGESAFVQRGQASPFSNQTNPTDVNADGIANEKDVDALMGMLKGHMSLDFRQEMGPFSVPCPDVNGDGFLTSQDVLQAINQIHREHSPGEGESNQPTSPHWNRTNPADVNADGIANAKDVDAVMSMLQGRTALDLRQEMGPFSAPYPDVNGDWFLTSQDVLPIINQIHRESAASGRP